MCFPDLVLSTIFKNLKLDELFKLRIVCKQWKRVIELNAEKQISLFVYGDDLYSPKEKWPTENRVISENEIIDQLFFEKFCLINNYFPNVKNLFFYRTFLIDFKTKGLQSKINNYLEKLEQFLIIDYKLKSEIFEDERYEPEYNSRDLPNKFSIKELTENLRIQDIIFSNLKTFVLKGDFLNFGFNLELNAPILENLNFDCIGYGLSNGIVTLSNYETLKSLKCFMPKYYDIKFLNLEYLICQNIVPDFQLSNYPNLKRLDLYPITKDMETIKRLQEQKVKLSRNNLIFTIYGFEYSKLNEKSKGILNDTFYVPQSVSYFNNIFKNKKDCHFFQIYNNEKMIKETNENHTKSIFPDWNFCFFYERVMGEKRMDFFSKFNIKRIIAYNLDDYDDMVNLIDFIGKISGIDDLVLDSCDIEKDLEFYFKKVPFITRLTLEKCDFEDFDFISNIINLKFLSIIINRSIMTFNHIQNLLINMKELNIRKFFIKNLNNFKFKNIENHKIEFKIYEPSHLNLDVGLHYFDNLNDLYLFLKESK